MNPIQLQDLQTLSDTLGDLINVGWSLTHGGSIFSAWVLSGDFSKISTFQKADVISAFQSLGTADRQSLEARLVTKVSLPEPAQTNFKGGVGIFERSVEFVYSVYALYQTGKQIVSDAEVLFGMKS